MNESNPAHPQPYVIPPFKLFARRIVNAIVKLITNILCKVEASQLDKIPEFGPLIVIVNHVNFLELPIIYPRVKTQLGIGFSKKENWKSLFYRLLFGLWDVIPIDRENLDMTAIRAGLEALAQGRILFITPEGTRSHHGRLQPAKTGVVLIAQRSGTPILPLACYGGEKFSANIKRLRRTDYHVVVGKPFYIETPTKRTPRAMRKQIGTEMMYQLAALLPPENRGVYADMAKATQEYLRFESET